VRGAERGGERQVATIANLVESGAEVRRALQFVDE
jgi:hypothetical protein